MSARSKRWRIFTIIIVVFVALGCFVAWWPTGKKELPPTGYTPLRDDYMAARYMPVFECPPEFAPILAVYYRAAWDSSGVFHIAYHPVWAKEWNATKAFGPFMSRCLYTGGLSLQRLMYGPGDIEAIGFSIDPASENVMEVDYETATDYNPSNFSVKHKKVLLKGNFASPLHFKVISWNHLFEFEDVASAETSAEAAVSAPGGIAVSGAASRSSDAAPAETSAAVDVVPSGGAAAAQTGTVATSAAPDDTASRSDSTEPAPPLSYFTSELWAKYGMWKNPETVLRKDRAHFVWERGAAP